MLIGMQETGSKTIEGKSLKKVLVNRFSQNIEWIVTSNTADSMALKNL